MIRCRICDRQFEMNFLSRYTGEDLCPVCEDAIVEAVEEMETQDDYPD